MDDEKKKHTQFPTRNDTTVNERTTDKEIEGTMEDVKRKFPKRKDESQVQETEVKVKFPLKSPVADKGIGCGETYSKIQPDPYHQSHPRFNNLRSRIDSSYELVSVSSLARGRGTTCLNCGSMDHDKKSCFNKPQGKRADNKSDTLPEEPDHQNSDKASTSYSLSESPKGSNQKTEPSIDINDNFGAWEAGDNFCASTSYSLSENSDKASTSYSLSENSDKASTSYSLSESPKGSDKKSFSGSLYKPQFAESRAHRVVDYLLKTEPSIDINDNFCSSQKLQRSAWEAGDDDREEEQGGRLRRRTALEWKHKRREKEKRQKQKRRERSEREEGEAEEEMVAEEFRF